MEYIDDLGNTYTDEDLEFMAEEIENENFSSFVPISDVMYGDPKPIDNSKSIISFQISNPIKERIVLFAKQNDCSVSDYLRAVIYNDISKQKL